MVFRRDENCQLIGLSFYYLDGRVYDPKWFIMAIENLRFAGFFGLTTLDRPTFNMIDIIPVAITTLDGPTIQVLSTYITILKSYSHSSPANPGCLKSAKITGAESTYTRSSSPAGPPTCCLPLRRPQLLYYMDGRSLVVLGRKKKNRGGGAMVFGGSIFQYGEKVSTHTQLSHHFIKSSFLQGQRSFTEKPFYLFMAFRDCKLR